MGQIILNILKIAVTVALLPVVAGSTSAFYLEMKDLGAVGYVFQIGMIAYVVVYLFFFQSNAIYSFFQRAFSEMLKFSPPLSFAVPKVIPLMPATVLLVYYILKVLLRAHVIQNYFIFFVGFLLCMHIIFTAKEIGGEGGGIVKPNYLCLMSVVYICNVAFIALLMDLNFSKFSIGAYFHHLTDHAQDFVRYATGMVR